MTTLQAHHRLSTCHRHPTTNPITGFCASCLRERLSSIEDSVSPTTRPRLRRTKSYSSTNPTNGTSTSEPRRKSCDVGPHANTLSTLFALESKPETKHRDPISNAVVVLKEEDGEDDGDGDGEFRTIKEFIDLEHECKNAGSRFSFWESAASAFSRKLLKWKLKQQGKNKKENEVFVDVLRGAKIETESEIGVYGYLGRRSCDTDPRLSVGDNGRYSFDEPRASWDGYLIGKAYPRLLAPPMPIVDEKEKEKESEGNGGEKSPGGPEKTRYYYGDSLTMQTRRRSFDKSSSVKRPGFVDIDELNGSNNNNINNKSGISNAKVSPESVGLFHGAKLLVTEKELRDSNWYSIKEYRAECVEYDSKNVGYVGGGSNERGFKYKKSLRRRNLWSIWGLIQKRNDGKCVDEEKFSSGKVNVVDEPLVQKLKNGENGEANAPVSEKLIRSYSVSARNPFQVDGSSNDMNGVEAKESDGWKKDELVLQRNRSTTYSPRNIDTGLLRFSLTPERSYRRSKSGGGGLKNLQSMAMSGL